MSPYTTPPLKSDPNCKFYWERETKRKKKFFFFFISEEKKAAS